LIVAKYNGEFGEEALIRDSDNTQAASCDDAVALKVVVYLLLMNVSIDFNHQRCLVTIEIRDGAVDNLLSSKMQPTTPIVA